MNRNLGYTNTSKIADSYVLGIVGIGMTAGRRESVCRIVGAGKGTVREHIAVKVIAYGVAIERDQTVVGVILEATVGCRGYIACCIVVEGLGRYNRVIAELLDSSRSDPAETIISITHFCRICKCLNRKTAAPESAAGHILYMFLRYSLYESFNEKHKKYN